MQDFHLLDFVGSLWAGSIICLFGFFLMYVWRFPFQKASLISLGFILVLLVSIFLPRRRGLGAIVVFFADGMNLVRLVVSGLGAFVTFIAVIELRRYPENAQVTVWLSVALLPLLLFLL